MDLCSLFFYFDFFRFLIGCSLSLISALVSYKLRALSFSGSLGMIIVGTIIFGIGGVSFGVPLVLFFVSSSILSKIKTPRKTKSMEMFDKSGPRDIYQVLANGGIGALSVLLFFVTNNSIWFFIYLASICEATADTWATELGTLSRSKPVSIIRFEKIDPGSSGGVSILGTASAAAGSLMIAGFSCLFLFFTYGSHDKWTVDFLIVFLFGFLGALFDSVIGGTIQGQFKCETCGVTTERQWHCGKRSRLTRGFRAINNDVVNLIGTTISALLAGLYFY